MEQRFQGAPTRTGRVILAVFGAPFMLAAAWLFGRVVLGDEAAGEKLAMVIGGAIFLIVASVIGWWKYLTGRW